MDAPATNVSSIIFYVILALLFALLAGGVAYNVLKRMRTIPSGNWEGFQGPSHGVSDIPCGQESADAVAISDLFASKESSTGDGSEDLKELKQILSKLCCIKHDLVSPNQVIVSTLSLPYSNSHDRETPSDTVARCFTKSVPIRDLDISFGTWKDRGLLLVNKLCTSYNLSGAESENVKKFFHNCWRDTFSVAKEVCVVPDGKGSVNPRDLNGLAPEAIKDLGPYKGYY